PFPQIGLVISFGREFASTGAVMMVRNWVWLVVILPLAGCGSGRSPAPLIVGQVAPLTGPEKAAGESALRGLRLALPEGNRDGSEGVGAPVLVLHADARPTRISFEAEALRLVQVNQAAALLGGWTADQLRGLDQSTVPVVSPGGFAGRKTGPNLFLTGLA